MDGKMMTNLTTETKDHPLP